MLTELQSVFLDSLFLAAGLLQALNTAAAVINGIGLLAAAASLIGACLSGMGERSIAGMKTSLVLAVVAGLAFLIAQAMFAAGGWATQVSPGALN